MAGRERVICSAGELVDGGDGVRFEVRRGGEAHAAFVVRFAGTVRAYLNRCAHVAVELDWNPGRFFDADGMVLICSTHGALYDPASGHCLDGPCRGAGLVPIAVAERNGEIVVADEAWSTDSGKR